LRAATSSAGCTRGTSVGVSRTRTSTAASTLPPAPNTGGATPEAPGCSSQRDSPMQRSRISASDRRSRSAVVRVYAV
jgi:hypothetical protein